MGVTLTDDSHDKYSVVDMTFHVQHVGAAIIIPYPQPGYKTYLLGAPFAPSVHLLSQYYKHAIKSDAFKHLGLARRFNHVYFDYCISLGDTS